jgi:hypothetical protein
MSNNFAKKPIIQTPNKPRIIQRSNHNEAGVLDPVLMHINPIHNNNARKKLFFFPKIQPQPQPKLPNINNKKNQPVIVVPTSINYYPIKKGNKNNKPPTNKPPTNKPPTNKPLTNKPPTNNPPTNRYKNKPPTKSGSRGPVSSPNNK